jgi:hypothetical protein
MLSKNLCLAYSKELRNKYICTCPFICVADDPKHLSDVLRDYPKQGKPSTTLAVVTVSKKAINMHNSTGQVWLN